MRQLILSVSCVSILFGCAQAPTNPQAGAATATQGISSSTIGGSVSNIATGGTLGSTTGGTASASVPINIALDPSAFQSIFGKAATSVTNPTKEAVQAVKSTTADPTVQQQAEKCMLDLAKCTITVKAN